MGGRNRILIFNVNWVGDVLFSTAFIRNVRYSFPDSYIACCVPPRCADVLEGNPYLNEVIIFDEKKRHWGPIGQLKFCGELRKKKFDTVFLLHRSFSRALLTLLAGIPERIGFFTKKRGGLLTSSFPAPDLLSMHRIQYYLELLRRAGLRVKDSHTDFPVWQKHGRVVDDFLSENAADCDFLVGINPGGNWGPKRWPKERFAELAGRLVREFKARVIVTGGIQDRDLAEEIERLSCERLLISCGKFSLKEFGALTMCLDLFITADSGPLHVANACGAKKIICLFGPTDPALTGPHPGDNAVIIRKKTTCAIPCYNVECEDNQCMKSISVEDVLAEVRKIRTPGTTSGV